MSPPPAMAGLSPVAPRHDTFATHLDVIASEQDRVRFATSFSTLLGEIDFLVTSDRFVANLGSIKALAVSTKESSDSDGKTIATELLAPHGPIHFTLSEDSWWPWSRVNATTAVSKDGATVTLFERPVTNILAGTDGAQACAVNTIVHEWSHAWLRPQTDHESFITDHRPTHAGTPLASYVIGSVAQCSYLERRHPELAPLSAKELAACVDAVGTTQFIAHCDQNWYPSFLAALRKK